MLDLFFLVEEKKIAKNKQTEKFAEIAFLFGGRFVLQRQNDINNHKHK